MRSLRSNLSKALVLLFVAFACLIVAFMPTFGANAQTADASDFYMMQGASVRLGSSESSETFKGIRFGSVITTSYYNELGEGVELHTLYGPASKYNAITDLTVDNYASNGFKDFKYENLIATVEDGVEAYRFNLVIDYSNLSSELLDSAFGVELMVRTYAKTANGDIIYAVENDNVRSMRGVALEALEKETNLQDWQVKALSQYIALTDNLTEYVNDAVATVDADGNFTVVNYDTEYVGEYKAFIGAEYIGIVTASNGIFNIDTTNFVDGEEYALKLVATNGSVVKQSVVLEEVVAETVSYTLKKEYVEVSDITGGITYYRSLANENYRQGYVFDANWTVDLTEYLDGASVLSVKLGEADYSTNYADGKLTIAKADLKTLYGNNNFELVAIVEENGKVVKNINVNIPVYFADVVFTTAVDFMAMPCYAGKAGLNGKAYQLDPNAHSAATPVLGGHFVLAENIDYTGFTYSMVYPHDDGINGFWHGVLDGDGHVVDNLTMSNNHALFATHFNSTIKNIAFTNVVWSSNNIYRGFLAWNFRDSNNAYENVYIQFKSVSSATNAFLLGFSYSNGGVKMGLNNVIIQVDEMLGSVSYYATIAGQLYEQTTSNVIVVGGDQLIAANKTIPSGITKVSTYAEISVNASDWNSAYWTVVDGVPYFNGTLAE